jgi:hypothetical protein
MYAKKNLYLLNIYINKELKFSNDVTNNSLCFRDVKNIICDRFEIYSVNYKMEAFGKDYTHYEVQELAEIFKGKGIVDIFVTSSNSFSVSSFHKVLISYEENKEYFLVYNFQAKTLIRITPEKSQKLQFSKGFPYNSRSCNYKKDNKLFFSGGIENESNLFEYDYDLNYLTHVPFSLRGSYQCHSMLTYGQYLYIIGGYNNKICDVYNIKEESLNKDFVLPDLEYDRTDPALIVVNHEFLVVFAGYSISQTDHLTNFERIKLYNPLDYYSTYNIKRCKKWDLISIYTPGHILTYKRANMAVINIEDGKVLLIGGLGIGVVKDEVFSFDFSTLTIGKSYCQLPNEIAFGEKSMITDDGQIFFGFNYGANKLLRINILTMQVGEIEIVN